MSIRLMTVSAYARHRGCDEKAVRQAIADGRITALPGERGRRLVDAEVADIQWARNTRARVGARTGQDLTGQRGVAGGVDAPDDKTPADPGYLQYRARRELADAEIAEMNAARMRGTVLMRDDVDRAMFEIGRDLRDSLGACARRIASEVAALATAEACEAVIEREHRITLQLLATAFREKAGASPRAPG